MTVLSVAEVAELAGVEPATIHTYVWRQRRLGAGGQNIPLPDAMLADRPAWHESTIRPWLDERRNGQ